MYDTSIKELKRNILFLSIIIILQLICKNISILNYSVAESGINAVFLLTILTNGTLSGVALASLTPILAFITGQLPTYFDAFLPFIIVGNILFVVIFGVVWNNHAGKYIALLVAASSKYLFLYLSTSKLATLFDIEISKELANGLITIMGTPQLMTSLTGGAIAFILIRYLPEKIISNFTSETTKIKF